MGRQHHVQHARQGEANHASSLEEEYGGHDGGRSSHLQICCNHLHVLRPRGNEFHAQGPGNWRNRVHRLDRNLSHGLVFRPFPVAPTHRTSPPTRGLAPICHGIPQSIHLPHPPTTSPSHQ